MSLGTAGLLQEKLFRPFTDWRTGLHGPQPSVYFNFAQDGIPSLINCGRTEDGAERDLIGDLRFVGAGVPRSNRDVTGTSSGLLGEVDSINKCENLNANPTDLTGLSKVGNASASLALVTDTTELSAVQAKLQKVCLGNVYKVDNTLGGSGDSNILINGQTGNTNQHSISCWSRCETGVCRIRLSGVGASTIVPSAIYNRVMLDDVTPAGSTGQFQFAVELGGIGYFILPQLEERTFTTSEIVTLGAAQARDNDDLDFDISAQFNPLEGAIFNDVVITGAINNGPMLRITNIALTDRFELRRSINQANFQVFAGGASQADIFNGALTDGHVRMGGSWKLSATTLARNSNAVATGGLATLPTGITKLAMNPPGSPFSITYHEIQYFATRPSDEDFFTLVKS